MREKHVYAFLRIQDCTGRHRGTTDLTWLPLATVRHHGRSCNSVKVEIKFHLECKLHFPCAHLMLQKTHLTNVSESTEARYWVCWHVNFFAWIRAMKTALEFVILCSNRGLQIEVTTRQKSVFPRCQPGHVFVLGILRWRERLGVTLVHSRAI